jgi:hypothetical protein
MNWVSGRVGEWVIGSFQLSVISSKVLQLRSPLNWQLVTDNCLDQIST